MKTVFVLISEPYHDNGSVISVYSDEKTAVTALRSTPDVKDINEPDYVLTEWDADTNTEGRVWSIRGKQIREPDGRGGTDVRIVFTFCDSEGVESCV